MPLRSENVMTTLLLGGVLVVVLIGTTGVVLVGIFAKESGTPMVTVIGFTATALTALIALLRGEVANHEGRTERAEIKAKVEESTEKTAQVHRDIKNGILEVAEDTNKKVDRLERKTDGETANVVKAVAAEVREAAESQAATKLLGDPAFVAVLREVAREVVAEALRQAKAS